MGEEQVEDKPAIFFAHNFKATLHFACNSSSNAALTAVFLFYPVTYYPLKTDG